MSLRLDVSSEQEEANEQENEDSENEDTKASDPEDAGEQVKKKRKRATYTKLQTFKSRNEMDLFIRKNNEFNVNITHNDQVKCTICDDIDHNMQQIYFKCCCKKCDLK